MQNYSLFTQLLSWGSKNEPTSAHQKASGNSVTRKIRRTLVLFFLGLTFFCSVSAVLLGEHQLVRAAIFNTEEHQAVSSITSGERTTDLVTATSRQNPVIAQLSSSDDTPKPSAKLPKRLTNIDAENDPNQINNKYEDKKHNLDPVLPPENSLDSASSRIGDRDLTDSSESSWQSSNRRSPRLLEEHTALELPPLSSPDEYIPEAFEGYAWPAQGTLTSGYGWRWGRLHQGIDIAAPIGTPVIAAAAGTVITADWSSGGYGNLVELEHPDGSVTLYAHNDKILVSVGQEIAQNQQIAEMGNTGFSTGSHLHFEIHLSGDSAVDPMTLLSKR